MPNTQSKEVNLTKRVQTNKGMRYCPVVLSANGRVKPDLVLVNSQPERHPEGAYYLEWRENGKCESAFPPFRLSIGKDAATATARRLQKEAEVNARNNGVAIAQVFTVDVFEGEIWAGLGEVIESSRIRGQRLRLLGELRLL